jgi:hypothetical protein
MGFVVPFGDFAIDKAPLSAFAELSVRQIKWKGKKSTQSQRLEYNHVPFRGRRQGSRMFSSQWTFRLGWPLGRVLLELKAVMAVNERN